MEKETIQILPCCILLNWIFMALEKFYPKYLSYISSFKCHDLSSWQHPLPIEGKISNTIDAKSETTDISDIRIKRDETAFVMSNIGISLSQGGDEMKDCFGHDEFSTLFEQTEPGLDEVKEAFSIFDQNRDGFIDAKELQRVLINLGLREGTDLDACQSMIDRHDRNRDGKLTLSDFSRLLESALL